MSYKFLIGGLSIYLVLFYLTMCWALSLLVLRKDLSQNNFILKFLGLMYKISLVDQVKIQELLVF